MPDGPIADSSRRIPSLDRFRGLMTLFVVLSHYFAEIEGGLPRLEIGFLAVDAFFVLSGFLVGRLILEKGGASNFFAVFYARRVCRTFPIYFLCLALAFGVGAALGIDGDRTVPAWSYFAFINNIFMVTGRGVGHPWLGPTWTMAVEEQFYLVVPLVLIAAPRSALLPLLAVVVAIVIVLRAVITGFGQNPFAALALLPTRADSLAIGIAGAVLLGSPIRWNGTVARTAPIVLLFVCLALRAWLGDSGLTVIGHTLICIAVVIFLLSLVHGAPEARRFEGRILRFFGETSYAVYLTHMPVLWALHAALLGASPNLSTAGGLAVTLVALPLTVGLATLLTHTVEAPITALGRRARWRFDPPAPARDGAIAV